MRSAWRVQYIEKERFLDISFSHIFLDNFNCLNEFLSLCGLNTFWASIISSSYILLLQWALLIKQTLWLRHLITHHFCYGRCIFIAVACHQNVTNVCWSLGVSRDPLFSPFSFAYALWYFGLFSLPATHNSCGGELYFSQLESSHSCSSAAVCLYPHSSLIWYWVSSRITWMAMRLNDTGMHTVGVFMLVRGKRRNSWAWWSPNCSRHDDEGWTLVSRGIFTDLLIKLWLTCTDVAKMCLLKFCLAIFIILNSSCTSSRQNGATLSLSNFGWG